MSKFKFFQKHIGFMFKSSKLKYCTQPVEAKARKNKELPTGKRLTVARKLKAYFQSAPHLQSVRSTVPSKYLKQRKYGLPENLYLVDSEIADDVANRISPMLKETDKHLICETNPGLGLISSRLLVQGIPRIRLYECCSDFRSKLKSLNDAYPGRIELFIKDLFHLGRYSFMDKMDKGDRVEQMLRDVPKHEWNEEPVMSIIGVMPSLVFMRYLLRMIMLQTEIVTRGRIQIFALLKCEDFMKITAGPHISNLRVYRSLSIFVDNFFNYKLLGEYPRKSFLPWESIKNQPLYIGCNYEVMYLVRLNMKEKFPLATEQLLPYYFFVRNVYSKPTQKIIPTLEKWIPGIGINIITSRYKTCGTRKQISIFTKFGELKPSEVVSLFRIVYDHPSYQSCPFKPMVDSQLLKTESVDTDLAEGTPITTEDLEEKMTPVNNS